MTDTNKVEPVAITKSLFCDMKSDKDKSNFFLSGRGYETGVIASAIQNDVALAYKRCDNYASALAAEQAKVRELVEVIEGICDMQDANEGYASVDSYDKARAAIAKYGERK